MTDNPTMAIPTADQTQGPVQGPRVSWRQFTVYSKNSKGRYFPIECLDTFLPDFISINKPIIDKWHFLFEPSVLVRYISPESEQVWESAKVVASGYKLIIEPGDTEQSSPIEANNFEWPGESIWYGDLEEANLNFLQACSELSLKLNTLPGGAKQVAMLQKHLHLFCNITGCNYAEEAAVCQERANKCVDNYRKYGRT